MWPSPSRALFLPWLCPRLLAQPLEGDLASISAGGPPPPDWSTGQARPARCPDGYYRSSGILWFCDGAAGKRAVHLNPHGTAGVALLPVGLANFSCKALARVEANLQLFDPGSKSFIVRHGKLHVPEFQPQGLYRYQRLGPRLEELWIDGIIAAPLYLRFRSTAETPGHVALSYRFDGVRPCGDAPKGCTVYDAEAAEREVRKWSAWAQETYGSVDVAWEDSKEIASRRHGGRRLKEGEERGISWFAWPNVWKLQNNGQTTRTSWQPAFHWFDHDGDERVSKAEFRKGYELGPKPTAFLQWWWCLLLLPLLLLVVCFLPVPCCVRQKKKKKHHEHQENKGTELKLQDRTLVPSEQQTLLEPPPPEVASPRAVTATEPLPPGKTVMLAEPTVESRFAATSTRERFCSLMSCAWGRSRPTEEATPVMLGAAATGEAPDEILALVRWMRAAPDDTQVQVAALQRLEQLALQPGIKSHIADSGALDATLVAMGRHPSSADVQEHGCALIGNQSSRSEEYQRLLADRGAAEAVLAAIMAHLRNRDAVRVQEMACWALRELALVKEGRKQIADHGGIERILQAMERHHDNAPVLEHGLMALAYLAYDVEIRRWIAYDGGIRSVIRLMDLQHQDGVVQEAACLTLRNLACSQEPQQEILDVGGVEAIVQAMRLHPKAVSLQETACDALQIIGAPAQQMSKLGAVELILHALEQHQEQDEGLVTKACRLLATLAYEDQDVRAQIKRSAGLISQAKRRHPGNAELQEAAEKALEVLGGPLYQ